MTIDYLNEDRQFGAALAEDFHLFRGQIVMVLRKASEVDEADSNAAKDVVFGVALLTDVLHQVRQGIIIGHCVLFI